MELLRELWNMEVIEEAKGPSKSKAASVYHRDYEKTKKKPYRKYSPEEYAQGKHKEAK